MGKSRNMLAAIVVAILVLPAGAINGLADPIDPAAGAYVSASGHSINSYETLSVGDSATYNYACQNDHPETDWIVTTTSWNSSGSTPLGMDFDNVNHRISGTPQAGTIGIYALEPIQCHVEGYGRSYDVTLDTGRLEILPPTLDHSQVTGGGRTSLTEEHLTVGVYADLDYSCVDSNPNSGTQVRTNGWSSLPEIPAGMTFDGMNDRIFGTPTAATYILLPSVICTVERLGYSQDFFKPLGSLVVDETPPPPPVDPGNVENIPAPELHVTPIRDAGCNFSVDTYYPYLLPADEGSPRLTISNGSRSITLDGLDPGHHSYDIISPFDLGIHGSEFGSWKYNGITDDGLSFFCGNDLSFSLTYRSADVLSLPAVIEHVYLSKELVDSVHLSRDFYETCEVNIDMTIAYQPDITAESQSHDATFFYEEYVGDITVFQAKFRLSDMKQDEEVEFTFYPNARQLADWSDASVHLISTIGQSGGCGSNSSAWFEYRHVGRFSGDGTSQSGLPKCGKGTWSVSGLDGWRHPCEDASIGTYVSTKGATEATSCPEGMTTDDTGTASINDCYKPILQTVKKITALKGLKLKAVSSFPAFTDQGTPLLITASGACTLVNVKLKSGVIYKVTAAKTAGICTLQLSAARGYHMPVLAKTLTFKVSKTGK
jgi:hypothetical protein